MKTKERLERAGWVYLQPFGLGIEIYTRKELRILYDSKDDSVFSYYSTDGSVREGETSVDDFILDLLCEKP